MTNPVETTGASLSHFVVDPRASKFTVQAFATGILSAMGHNPKIGIGRFSGEIDFNSKTLEGRGLRLAIDANSLHVLDDISDKDRREIERVMNEQVLEVAKYPEIVYEASVATVTRRDPSLCFAELKGTLRFHGVAREQPLTARVAEYEEMLRVSGQFALRQSDYQIKPVTVAAGALKLKDEVRFSFELVARAKP